jgi:hypothetical protein
MNVASRKRAITTRLLDLDLGPPRFADAYEIVGVLARSALFGFFCGGALGRDALPRPRIGRASIIPPRPTGEQSGLFKPRS